MFIVSWNTSFQHTATHFACGRTQLFREKQLANAGRARFHRGARVKARSDEPVRGACSTSLGRVRLLCQFG
jgi:hypothetical protein